MGGSSQLPPLASGLGWPVRVTAPDLGHGVSPPSRHWPWMWGSSPLPPPLTLDVGCLLLATRDKTPEKQRNEVEIGNFPEKEFRIMIVNMIQNLGKRMEVKIEKMQEMLTKDLEEIKNKQTDE